MKKPPLFVLAASALVVLSACGSPAGDAGSDIAADPAETSTAPTDVAAAAATTVPTAVLALPTESEATPASVDSSAAPTGSAESSGIDMFVSYFAGGALLDADIVPCTFESGTETECYRLLASSEPDAVGETGPFCPESVTDPNYGIFTWDGDNPGLYALDEQFWTMMESFGYDFVDPDGTVHVSDPGEGRPGGGPGQDGGPGQVGTGPGQNGGGPDQDGEARQATCLEATPDDSYTLQMLIPIEPELLDTPTALDTVAQIGVAVDGGTIFGDAPSGTSGAIPALDPCGGHYDPSGY